MLFLWLSLHYKSQHLFHKWPCWIELFLHEVVFTMVFSENVPCIIANYLSLVFVWALLGITGSWKTHYFGYHFLFFLERYFIVRHDVWNENDYYFYVDQKEAICIKCIFNWDKSMHHKNWNIFNKVTKFHRPSIVSSTGIWLISNYVCSWNAVPIEDQDLVDWSLFRSNEGCLRAIVTFSWIPSTIAPFTYNQQHRFIKCCEILYVTGIICDNNF